MSAVEIQECINHPRYIIMYIAYIVTGVISSGQNMV